MKCFLLILAFDVAVVKFEISLGPSRAMVVIAEEILESGIMLCKRGMLKTYRLESNRFLKR